MKQLLTLSLLVVTVICNGQQIWTAEPLKKCNKIGISPKDTQVIKMKEVMDVLLNAGYEINTYSSEFGYINTKPKRYKGSFQCELNFIIRPEDSISVIITGKFSCPGIMANEPIENIGQSKSPAKLAWNEMYNVAQMVPGNKSYLKP